MMMEDVAALYGDGGCSCSDVALYDDGGCSCSLW